MDYDAHEITRAHNLNNREPVNLPQSEVADFIVQEWVEVTRAYRLDLNKGEPNWADPIAPEVTSNVLGRRVTCTINRASLLAWSLMTLPEVEIADLTGEGWIKIAISTGPDFDEQSFKNQVAEVVADVSRVRSRPERQMGRLAPPRSARTASPFGRAPAAR